MVELLDKALILEVLARPNTGVNLSYFFKLTDKVNTSDLKEVSYETLETKLKIRSKHVESQRLIEMFIELTVLRSKDYKRYLKRNFQMQRDLITYMFEHNLEPLWLKLLRRYLSSKNDIANQIYNELSNTYLLLIMVSGSHIVGYDRVKQCLLTKSVIFGNEIPTYKEVANSFYKGSITINQYKAKLAKLNSTLTSTEDLELAEESQTNYFQTMIAIATIFNEKMELVLPSRFIMHESPHAFGEYVSMYDIIDVFSNVQVRNKLLPTYGVSVDLYNSPWERLDMLESITDKDEVILTFKLSSEKLGDYVFSFITNSDDDKTKYLVAFVTGGGTDLGFPSNLGFALEIYHDLTKDDKLEYNRMRKYRTLRVNSGDEVTRSETILQYVVHEMSAPEMGDIKSPIRHKQRTHYRKATTRKLPMGWKRSLEAEERAKRLGIELKDGETFVPEYLVNGAIEE